MLESQAVGMKRLPRQSGSRRAAVELVAHQRMADMRHVDADLVRAAGLPAWRAPSSRAGASCSSSNAVDAGFAALDHRHAQAVARIAADRRVHMAHRRRRPRRDAPAPRTGAPPRARRCAAPARPSSARVRATTIRPLVSLSSRCTMPARGSSAAPAVAREQAIEQRAAPVARRRMHHQPGRLVDHQQVLVLEHHRQAIGSGRKAWLCGVGRSSISPCVAGLHLAAPSGCAARALERHRARFDQLLQVAARELRHQRGQRAVEPLAVVRRVDHEWPQFGVRARRPRRPRALALRLWRLGVGRYNEFALFQESCE